MEKESKREAGTALRKDGRKGIAKWKKSGATFLEYALLLALVGIVGAIGLKKYGGAIKDFFFAMAEKTAEVTPDTTKSK